MYVCLFVLHFLCAFLWYTIIFSTRPPFLHVKETIIQSNRQCIVCWKHYNVVTNNIAYIFMCVAAEESIIVGHVSSRAVVGWCRFSEKEVVVVTEHIIKVVVAVIVQAVAVILHDTECLFDEAKNICRSWSVTAHPSGDHPPSDDIIIKLIRENSNVPAAQMSSMTGRLDPGWHVAATIEWHRKGIVAARIDW